jgi:CPA2 family monovalent cation:H+ antiporter-2
MNELPILRDLVILVAVAIPVVVLAHRAKVPSVVGFLLTGMLIGPHALGLIGGNASVQELAEVGTVLLLFAIGLELQLSRILRMGREVLQGGAVQLLATAAVFATIGLIAGQPAGRAAFAGALVAFSSTAIILKVYAMRGELETAHGRVVVAIAVFQDLAVVPVMLLVPVLAGTAGGSLAAAGRIAMSLVPLAALVIVGRFLVPPLLERVVRLRNREIFTLSIVFLGLGAAYVASHFGISLALGAFIAGLVIAESEYGLQALSDVLPFRDTFSGIFFTSVGMLLDPREIAARPALVIGAAVAIVVIKAVIATGAVLSVRRPLVASITAGVGLAQVGEFSFVLASAGAAQGLLAPDQYQLFLATTVLSMLAAPFLIAGARPVAVWIASRMRVGLERRAEARSEASPSADHVIIVGYGLNGRTVARALRAAGIQYVVLEQSGDVMRRAREANEPIRFGDGTSAEVLERVGIARARVIVFAIAENETERRGIAVARGLNPAIHIVVRTRYVASIDELQRLGADEVVPEEFETSLEVFARVLRTYGVSGSTIRQQIDQARRDHYEVFHRRARTYGHLTDLAVTHGVEVSVETQEVAVDSKAIGKNPVTMALRRLTGATVIAVIRGHEVIYEPRKDFRFAAGDAVVLVGVTGSLEKAMTLFRAGEGPRNPETEAS